MFLEKLFVKKILNANTLQLRNMVVNNDNVVIWACKQWPSLISGTRLVSGLLSKETNKININRILKSIKNTRPDVYQILTTPQGFAWLDLQIKWAEWGFNNLDLLEKEVRR